MTGAASRSTRIYAFVYLFCALFGQQIVAGDQCGDDTLIADGAAARQIDTCQNNLLRLLEKGNAISMAARVLATANTFSAMVRHRAYRASMPTEKTLSILAKSKRKYDAQVVQALEKVFQSALGEKIIG